MKIILKICAKMILSISMLAGLIACGSDEPTESVESVAADITSSSEASSSTLVVCDRECLEGFVDQYLNALVANDHTQAPFSSDAKFTENAQILKLGDALWGTASALPEGFRLLAADPETGNIGFWFIMEEVGEPIWLTGRLKVENQEITELETVIIRSGGGFSGFDHEAPDPMWAEVVPPEERNTRAELFDAADRYMEALEQNLVDHAVFDESCDRLENGVKTANNPDSEGIGAGSCQDNINSGMWVYIQDISPRRFLIADEERGIAMGVFMFHQDGSDEFAMVNGEKVMYSGATRRPFTTVIPEMFKVKNGKIYRIMASMTSIPYKSKSGWEPGQ